MTCSSQIYKPAKEIFESEQEWIIPRWVHVQQNEIMTRNQTFEFQTGNARFDSRWIVGLDIVASGMSSMIRPYLKLNELTGMYDHLETSFGAHIFKGTPQTNQCINKVQKILGVGDVLRTTTDMWPIRHPSPNYFPPLGPNGSLTILISLSIHLVMSPIDECNQKSLKLLSEKLAYILDTHSHADLKIITSDKKELLAHQFILKTQNDVFASMFRSKFSEGTTGIIKIDETTGKTMKVLLHHIYTGILLPEWEDDDTIVEFTYAAEKYQLPHVLDMLDKCLGYRTNQSVSFVDVQLLDRTIKMSLKNAEKVLLKKIVTAIYNAKSADELFLIINLDDDVVDVPDSKEDFLVAFRVLNSVIGDEDSSEFLESDFHLLALAGRHSMYNVESKLLQNLRKQSRSWKALPNFWS